MIRLENVSKEYESLESVKVLEDINLEIKPSSMIAFDGPSGIGKSTLLYLIGTLLKPSSGKIYYQNQDITNLPDNKLTKIRANDFGFIFQDYRYIEALTLKDNLFLNARLNNNLSICEEDIDRHLDSLNLLDKKFYLPSELSGGQKRRLMVLNALIKDPKIILADEPTNDLDDINSQKVMSLLNEQASLGKAVILVTHNHKVSDWAKDVYEIENKKIKNRREI